MHMSNARCPICQVVVTLSDQPCDYQLVCVVICQAGDKSAKSPSRSRRRSCGCHELTTIQIGLSESESWRDKAYVEASELVVSAIGVMIGIAFRDQPGRISRAQDQDHGVLVIVYPVVCRPPVYAVSMLS